MQVDAVNWLMEALASSGDMHYHPALLRLADTARDPGIAKNAGRYAALLAEIAERRQGQ